MTFAEALNQHRKEMVLGSVFLLVAAGVIRNVPSFLNKGLDRPLDAGVSKALSEEIVDGKAVLTGERYKAPLVFESFDDLKAAMVGRIDDVQLQWARDDGGAHYLSPIIKYMRDDENGLDVQHIIELYGVDQGDANKDRLIKRFEVTPEMFREILDVDTGHGAYPPIIQLPQDEPYGRGEMEFSPVSKPRM